MESRGGDIYAFVGERLRFLRKERGLTLEELATAVGMNTSFLHYIERNKKAPSLRMLYNIASTLGVSMSDLFKDAPSPAKPDDVYAAKIGVLVRDADVKTRRRAFEVLKTLVRDI